MSDASILTRDRASGGEETARRYGEGMIGLLRPLVLAIPVALLLAGCAAPADPAAAPTSASAEPGTPTAEPTAPLAAELGASRVPAECGELLPETTASLGAELRSTDTLGVIGVSAMHAGLLECFFPADDGESVSVVVLPEPTPAFADLVSGDGSVAIADGSMIASCWGGDDDARTCEASMAVGDYAAELFINRGDESTFSAADVRDEAATELAAALAALPAPLAPAEPDGDTALPASCDALDLSGTPAADGRPALAAPAQDAPGGSGDGPRLFFIASERAGHLHCTWRLGGASLDGISLEAVPGAAWGLEAAGFDGGEIDIPGAELAVGALSAQPGLYRLAASVGADLLQISVSDPALTEEELRASAVAVLQAIVAAAE